MLPTHTGGAVTVVEREGGAGGRAHRGLIDAGAGHWFHCNSFSCLRLTALPFGNIGGARQMAAHWRARPRAYPLIQRLR